MTQAQFQERQFNLMQVMGLSRAALDLHLELYRGYVKQSNILQTAIADISGRSKLSDEETLLRDSLVRRLPFENNGRVLHELFFEQLDGKHTLTTLDTDSVLKKAMDISFGGVEGWRADIERLAQTRGVGWVLSTREPDSNRLTNYWICEHQLGVPVGARLIAVFDIWEHAYLLDFAPSARSHYLNVLFQELDWAVLESRCQD